MQQLLWSRTNFRNQNCRKPVKIISFFYPELPKEISNKYKFRDFGYMGGIYVVSEKNISENFFPRNFLRENWFPRNIFSEKTLFRENSFPRKSSREHWNPRKQVTEKWSTKWAAAGKFENLTVNCDRCGLYFVVFF